MNDLVKLVAMRDRIPQEVRQVRLSVVISALYEERNSPYVAARIPNNVDEIIFVDGRSVNFTVLVARQLWPRRYALCRRAREKVTLSPTALPPRVAPHEWAAFVV